MPKAASKSAGNYNIFPVGIAYVTAYLKKMGCNIYTANLEFLGGDTYLNLNNLISELNIDVIAVSGLSRDYPKVKSIIEISKYIKPEIITIVGGGIISGDPEPAMLALGADIGTIGEGEKTAYDLTNALDNGHSFHDIPGLIFRNEDNGLTISSYKPEVINIEEISIPDYDGFDYSKFMESVNYSYSYIVASRSCPYHCTFCFHPSGSKYRQRSLDSVFDEIDYILKQYKVRTIGISDELFAIKKDRVVDFCDRIKKLHVNWTVQLRVDDVDPELLRLMKESGCICISYGIESASNSVLKSMNKNITVEEIDKALELTYKNNIDIQGGLIFGDSAETPETITKSLNWYNERIHYALELNMVQIFPGSILYKNAIKEGTIKDPVNFLVDGCPLTNITQLSDEDYRSIASNIYETNMRAKYPPLKYSLIEIHENLQCAFEVYCNKCNHPTYVPMDILHNCRIICNHCNQRHYFDPFEVLIHSNEKISKLFYDSELMAIWGAGELCIKLLDRYEIFKDEKFMVVDVSKSRQNYTIRDKLIYSPEIIDKKNIAHIIIAVVRSKNDIIDSIKLHYPSVKKIYVPHFESISNQLIFTLNEQNIEDKYHV